MLTIYKFPIPIADNFTLPLPSGAACLSVQVQHGQPCLWALCEDPEAGPIKPRKFRLAGTGHPIAKGGKFVGTFQLNGGALVCHLFEL